MLQLKSGFVGDNIDTLVALTQRAQEIARKNDMVMEVRNSWGNKVPVWKPLYSQEKGLRLGITVSRWLIRFVRQPMACL